MNQQSDIADILTGMTAGGLKAPRAGSRHRGRMEELMRHFAARKIPLSTCADDRHLGRSVATLKRYARDFGLAFPDYVPLALRPKKPGPKKV